jgi:hypothetical protein
VHRLFKLLVIAVIILGSHASLAASGKFYIVGMGTATDLITVRGGEVIKGADIILLEQPSERDYWKEFIGNKDVWYCPHGARVGLGLDPKTVRASEMLFDPRRAITLHKIYSKHRGARLGTCQRIAIEPLQGWELQSRHLQ